MTKLPAPPPRLEPIEPSDLVTVGGDVLWRVHPTSGPHIRPWHRFRRYGPLQARFDPHHPPVGEHHDRGVLCAATTVPTALAEVYQNTRRVDVGAGGPHLVGFAPADAMELLDLSGGWITRAGASQAIATGSKARARQWARAIADAHPDLAGLWYPSSMWGPGHNVALWLPAETTLQTAEVVFARPLSHPQLRPALEQACRDIGYALDGWPT